MVRKSLFKYILFTLLMVFLFVPSVKASTTYLACEYAPTGNVVDSYYIDRVRVIVRNNKWVMVRDPNDIFNRRSYANIYGS